MGNGRPFGNRDFAAFVVGIFGGSATVRFERLRTVNGQAAFEYSFAVSLSASHYVIANSVETIPTAFSESFLLDPQSSDLVRPTGQTAELPVTTNACQATSKVEYQRVGSHGQNVLVPRQTDLRTTFRDSTETVGLTSYSNCGEYAGRTVMRFDVAELATKTSAPRPQSPRLLQ